jgi:simple sugar transport system ATP-binding protein
LALFGVNPPDGGTILFEGKPVKINSIQDAIRLGIAYVPEDRLTQGLVMNQAVEKNLIITTLHELVDRFGLIQTDRQEQFVNRWVKDLSIKIPSVQSPVQTLSGGNQQRVVLAKWIATNPKVLILDGPTIGIDVAAKFAIHEIIRKLAQQGIAIILISEEAVEVFTNCNRVMVMHKGRFVREMITAQSSLEEIQGAVDAAN